MKSKITLLLKKVLAKPTTLVFFALLFLYCAYSISDVFSSAQMYIENGNRFFAHLFLILIILLLFSYSLVCIIRSIKTHSFPSFTNNKLFYLLLFSFFTFILLTIISSLINGINSNNISYFFNNCCYYCVSFLLIVSFFFFKRNGVSNKQILFFSFIILALYFSIMVFFFFRTLVTPLKTGFIRYPQLSHSFCMLAPFFFVRLLGNKKQIIFGYVVTIFIILLSIKRSLIIAFLIIGLIELIYSLIKNKKNRLPIIMVSVCVVSTLIFVAILVNNLTGGKLFSKFTFEEMSSGSGRNEIWEKVFESLSSFSLKNYIFGKGPYGVFLYATNGLGAHNDYLEILYDFGILAVISFALFIAMLLVSVIVHFKKIKSIPNLGLSFSFCLIILFMLSMVSSIFSNTDILIYGFVGFCFSFLSLNLEKKEAAVDVH